MPRFGIIFSCLLCVLVSPVIADVVPQQASAQTMRSADPEARKQAREEAAERKRVRKKERELAREQDRLLREQLRRLDPHAPQSVPEGTAAPTNVGTPAKSVSYDKKNDQLTVVAEQASLKQVLAKIAQLSGVEVLFDDKANAALTVTIEAASLEDGIKRILKGRNSSLRYSKNAQDQLLLVGVTVLPAGQHDSLQARRLMALDQELYYRLNHGEDAGIKDKRTERWEARLEKLPEAQREILQKRIDGYKLKRALAEQKEAEREARRKSRGDKSEARKQARIEKHLANMSPEKREIYEQRAAKAEAEVREIVFKELKKSNN